VVALALPVRRLRRRVDDRGDLTVRVLGHVREVPALRPPARGRRQHEVCVALWVVGRGVMGGFQLVHRCSSPSRTRERDTRLWRRRRAAEGRGRHAPPDAGRDAGCPKSTQDHCWRGRGGLATAAALCSVGSCRPAWPGWKSSPTQRLTRIKLTRIPGCFSRLHLVPGLITKSNIPWMKMQYLTGGNGYMQIQLPQVDQICRFQGKIRMKVDKIA
jgi:hypothetical protein